MYCYIVAIIRFTWYTIKHKWYVFLGCWRLDLFGQGIIHDMSKYNPIEFFGYAFYYHSGQRPPWVRALYEIAWEHHWRNSPHHWEFWVVGETAVPMHNDYVAEMVVDWWAAGKAKGKIGCKAWYLQSDRMTLNSETRCRVLHYLREIDDW